MSYMPTQYIVDGTKILFHFVQDWILLIFHLAFISSQRSR
jgi:hypothetical protein